MTIARKGTETGLQPGGHRLALCNHAGMNLWELSDLATPWCVHVAATLRIAEHIEAGHHDIAALAAASGADRGALHRLLRHLVAKGVFAEPDRGSFELNDAARQFLGEPLRLGLDLDGFGGRMAHAWGSLLQAVRTGVPAYHEVFGRPFWDDLDAHPQISAEFDALMGPAGHGKPDPDVLAEKDWEGVRTVVDVGGGTGALLAAILQAHPAVKGILVDLPRTIARAGEFFRLAGVEDRVATVGQSFFDPLPAGGDLYVLKSVLDDWPDREAVAILKRCAEAARPAGRLVVFNNAGPGEEAPPDLLMLVLLGGRGRTVEDFIEMGGEAGLLLERVERAKSGKVLLQFRPL